MVVLAEEAAFEVMVTADQGLNYQQNMKERKLAVVVLSTGNKKCILANAARILAAINDALPGSYALVEIHT